MLGLTFAMLMVLGLVSLLASYSLTRRGDPNIFDRRFSGSWASANAAVRNRIREYGLN